MKDLYLFETKGIWYTETDDEDVMIGDSEALFRWLGTELGLDQFIPMTVAQAATEFDYAYSTVAEWVREGVVDARKVFGTWLVTRAAMKEYARRGKDNG